MKISNNKFDIYNHNDNKIEQFYLNLQDIGSAAISSPICNLSQYFGFVQCNFRESFVVPDNKLFEKILFKTEKTVKAFTDLSKYQIYMKVF